VTDSHIKTSHVKRAFSLAVESYDAHAVLQREVADRLLCLFYTSPSPRD